METNQLSSPQNLFVPEVSAQPPLSKRKLIPIVVLSVLLTAVITGTVVFFWENSISQDTKNNQKQDINTVEDQTTQVTATQSTPPPTPPPISQLEPTTLQANLVAGKFLYRNFSMDYPDDWNLLDMSINQPFPLQDRLMPLYGSSKVIALEKNGTYLLITIEPESGGSAGGIFTSESDFNDFISTNDQVDIDKSVFYLSKNHTSISKLQESHSGPWGWGMLAEYLPNKKIQTGEEFKGYEFVIKRNNYTYNFIVTSEDGGVTDAKLQEEILAILNTINW